MDHTSALVVIDAHQQTAKSNVLMAQANGTGGFVEPAAEETTTLTIDDQTGSNGVTPNGNPGSGNQINV